jgi:hypothetical protein
MVAVASTSASFQPPQILQGTAKENPFSRLGPDVIENILDFARDVRITPTCREFLTAANTLIRRKWMLVDMNTMPYTCQTLPDPLHPPLAFKVTSAGDLQRASDGLKLKCKEEGNLHLAVTARDKVNGAFDPVNFTTMEQAARQAESDRNLELMWPRILEALGVSFFPLKASEIKVWLQTHTAELALIRKLSFCKLNLSMIPDEISSLALPNVVSIDFSENQLKSIPRSFGAYWNRLRCIYFQFNQLTVLPADFGENWTQLRALIMGHNKLQNLPENFGATWNQLNDLDIHVNSLKTLPANFGANWILLGYLLMDCNQLHTLPADFGISWTGLSELNLMYNKLENLPNNFGIHWNRLDTLKLSCNQLKTLTPNLGANWPWWDEKRTNILHGNPVSAPPPVPWTPQVDSEAPPSEAPMQKETPKIDSEAPIPKVQSAFMNSPAVHLLSTVALVAIATYAIGWKLPAAIGAVYLSHRYSRGDLWSL